MIKKIVILSTLLLVSSSFLCAEQEDNLQIPTRSLLDIALETIDKHEPTKTFYDNLSQEKKQEVAEFLASLETIVAQTLEQMSMLGQKHKELIEQYKQACKVKTFNFNFELTPVIEN